MKRRLIQSYYKFELTKKEMARLRKLRGIGKVINKINGKAGVRGIIISDTAIEINVEGGKPRVEEVVDKVESIIKEELI